MSNLLTDFLAGKPVNSIRNSGYEMLIDDVDRPVMKVTHEVVLALLAIKDEEIEKRIRHIERLKSETYVLATEMIHIEKHRPFSELIAENARITADLVKARTEALDWHTDRTALWDHVKLKGDPVAVCRAHRATIAKAREETP